MKLVRFALPLLMSLAALPADAQTRSLFDQPEAQQAPSPTRAAPPSDVARQRDLFVDRIQRADKKATATICVDGCRGERFGSGQPKDPFTPLPDFSSDGATAYETDP